MQYLKQIRVLGSLAVVWLLVSVAFAQQTTEKQPPFKEFSQTIISQLNLTAEQQEMLQKAVEQARSKVRQNFQTNKNNPGARKKNVNAALGELNKKIESFLSEEQKQTFSKIKEEVQQKLATRLEDRMLNEP